MMPNREENDPIVEKKVGKKYLHMPSSHKLPVYYDAFSLYDRALPRICQKINERDGYLALIDIGANIGDSVSLVTDEVQGSFLCIEGDDEYLPFLKINTNNLKGSQVSIEESYCSEHDGGGSHCLTVERNNGTAKIVSSKNDNHGIDARFKTLNTIVEQHAHFNNANVVKIDTDGFEINVLLGGEKFLQQATPVLYFEFTPELYHNNNQDPLSVFDFLHRNGYHQVLWYDNFGRPVTIIETSDDRSIKELIDAIDNHTIFYYDILACHESKRERYDALYKNELLSSFRVINSELSAAKSGLEAAALELLAATAELEAAKSASQLITAELNQIQASRQWKLVMTLQKIAGCFRPKPQKKNKIVYIGHSYHEKTKSTGFILEYLRNFYEVEVVLDESWKGEGEPYPDLAFIDRSYLCVIFFQNLPDNAVLKKIKNKNIVFFPMYDASYHHDVDYWKALKKLKIINFSKTLHDKLSSWGLDTMYIQYFPTPREFVPGNSDELFFWQRLTRIDINVVAQLLGNAELRLHIHRTVDPGQQFQQPTEEQERQYHITCSDWFESRDEMLDLIKQKGIYIAPREFEGIGLSFLEAMAMGKAVIAVDNPTMNEYIKQGETGYLFDLKSPKAIDLSTIEDVQKNTFEFMKNGFEKWEKEKHDIIAFVEKR